MQNRGTVAAMILFDAFGKFDQICSFSYSAEGSTNNGGGGNLGFFFSEETKSSLAIDKY